MEALRKGLLDEKEAADYLGMTVKFLQARRWKRLPPNYCKIGSACRYRRDDLDSFIEDNMALGNEHWRR